MLIGGAYVKCGLGACPAFRPDWMSRIVNYGKYSSNCLARWSRQIEDTGLRGAQQLAENLGTAPTLLSAGLQDAL